MEKRISKEPLKKPGSLNAFRLLFFTLTLSACKLPLFRSAEATMAPTETPPALTEPAPEEQASSSEPAIVATPTEIAVQTFQPTSEYLLNPETFTMSGLRNLILTIDETKIAWPEVRDQHKGVPDRSSPGLDGQLIPHRALYTVDTGTDDMTLLGGGRFDFDGKVDQGIGQSSDEKLEGYNGKIVIDPVSGLPLFVVNGDKIMIPGGSDNFFRTNLLIFVGNLNDNTVTDLEVDVKSNFEEQRATAVANGDPISSEGVQWIASYLKSYVKSAVDAGHCHGAEGCTDAVGVYIIRGAHDDPPVGQPATLLFATVYNGNELQQLQK